MAKLAKPSNNLLDNRPVKIALIAIGVAGAILIMQFVAFRSVMSGESGLASLESILSKSLKGKVTLRGASIWGVSGVQMNGFDVAWGPKGGMRLKADFVNLRFSLWRVFRKDYSLEELTLTRPYLTVERNCREGCSFSDMGPKSAGGKDEPAGGTGEKKEKLSLDVSHIPKLKIVDGSIELKLLRGGEARTFRVEGVNAHASAGRDGKSKGRAEIDSFAGSTLGLKDLRGDIVWQDGVVRIKGMKAGLGEGRALVSGQLNFIEGKPDYELRLGLTGVPLHELIEELSGIEDIVDGKLRGDIEISGNARDLYGVKSKFKLSMKGANLRLPLTEEAKAAKDFLTLDGVDFAVEGEKIGDEAVVQAEADAGWAKANLNDGHFTLKEGAGRDGGSVLLYDFKVSALTDDIARLASFVPEFEAPIEGKGSGHVVFVGRSDKPDAAKADALIALTDGKIFQNPSCRDCKKDVIDFKKAKVAVAYTGGGWKFDDLALESNEASFRARGGISPKGAIKFSGSAAFAPPLARRIYGLSHQLTGLQEDEKTPVLADLKISGSGATPIVRWIPAAEWAAGHVLKSEQIEPPPVAEKEQKKNILERISSFIGHVF